MNNKSGLISMSITKNILITGILNYCFCIKHTFESLYNNCMVFVPLDPPKSFLRKIFFRITVEGMFKYKDIQYVC